MALIVAFAALLALGASASAQTAEVHLADDALLSANSSAPHGRLPVLFVHGHNTDGDESTNPNYRKNWQNSLNGLPSFKQSLDLPENGGLGIEPYYIRFQSQDRSITEDAAEISDAIERILQRHDPNYPAQPTHVQVVIIAYSKGTISARLYLKNLQTERPGFRPVSEFVAIAPPNHGINVSGLGGLTSTAGQELFNGYGLTTCAPVFPVATRDFIENLNGHPIEDTQVLDTNESYASEAPGSRPDTDPTGAPNPPINGTLYVTIFADGNRDFVGGDDASNDCQGRRLAKNIAPTQSTSKSPALPATISLPYIKTRSTRPRLSASHFTPPYTTARRWARPARTLVAYPLSRPRRGRRQCSRSISLAACRLRLVPAVRREPSF